VSQAYGGCTDTVLLAGTRRNQNGSCSSVDERCGGGPVESLDRQATLLCVSYCALRGAIPCWVGTGHHLHNTVRPYCCKVQCTLRRVPASTTANIRRNACSFTNLPKGANLTSPHAWKGSLRAANQPEHAVTTQNSTALHSPTLELTKALLPLTEMGTLL
jgi:hypothetical protein